MTTDLDQAVSCGSDNIDHVNANVDDRDPGTDNTQVSAELPPLCRNETEVIPEIVTVCDSANSEKPKEKHNSSKDTEDVPSDVSQNVDPDVEPSGPTVRKYGFPVKKRQPLKKPSPVVDLTDDHGTVSLLNVQPPHTAEGVTNVDRSESTVGTKDGGVKPDVAQKRKLKSVVKTKKDSSRSSSAATKENSLNSDAPINFDIEIAMCDEILESLPDERSPTQTPFHLSIVNDESTLKLHPSPTLAIEEPVPVSEVCSSARSLDRTLPESRPSKCKTSHLGSDFTSVRKNSKRSSPGEVSKVTKRPKESIATSSKAVRAEELSKFKIPRRPAQGRQNVQLDSHDRQYHPTPYRGRGFRQNVGRGGAQNYRRDSTAWGYNPRPTADRHLCRLTEEQFRWLDRMPSQWYTH